MKRTPLSCLVLTVLVAMLCLTLACCGRTCEHNFSLSATEAASCIEDGTETYTCSECGEVKTEVLVAIGHDYTEAITEATCTAEGKKVIACANCGDEQTEVIPATGHSYGDAVITEATCTAEGKKVITCTACGDEQTETIAMVAHTYESKVTKTATCPVPAKRLSPVLFAAIAILRPFPRQDTAMKRKTPSSPLVRKRA